VMMQLFLLSDLLHEEYANNSQGHISIIKKG